MRLLVALCVAVGFGAMLVGSAAVAPRPEPGTAWPGPGVGARLWGAAVASTPAAMDDDESEETTCPDRRSRQ